MSSTSLTEQEQEVVDLLSRAWNAHLALEELHEADRHEFMHGIHACQKIVMARPVQRQFNKKQACAAVRRWESLS